MSIITFELSDAIIGALALSRGWQPTVDDTEQEMDGDNYPQKPNPVTAVKFVEFLAPEFITEVVKQGARERLMTEFSGIFGQVEHQVKHGAFDQMLLSGNIEGIKSMVKASL